MATEVTRLLSLSGPTRLRQRVAALPPAALSAMIGCVALVVATAGATALAELTDSVLSRGRAVSIDVQVHTWFVDHRVAWLTAMMKVLTQFGSAPVITAVVLIAATAAVAARRHRDAAFVIAATAGAAVASTLIKVTIARARPAGVDQLVHITGAAFPSSHTVQATACYGAIAIVLARRSQRWSTSLFASASAALIAFGVGLSRVYLGVHWLSDVVAGWALGATWLATLVGAVSGYRLLRRRPPVRHDSAAHERDSVPLPRVPM